MMTAVKLRRLRTSDLDRIEELERESYPTPWSRSMFAGELAKPSGVCVGAFQGEDMLGYLIVARYVDAWHIMNVAVDPMWRGRGIARVLLERRCLQHAQRDRPPAVGGTRRTPPGSRALRAARPRRYVPVPSAGFV